MTRILSSIVSITSIALTCVAVDISAAQFGNTYGESSWADTPRGRFECVNNAATEHRQVLRLNKQLLYQQTSQHAEPSETDLLKNGIVHRDIGCPEILGSEGGFVIMVRALQPPQYQEYGYLAVDFNETDPVLLELGTGQGPKDEGISSARRLVWMPGGLALSYFGYPLGGNPTAEPNIKPGEQRTLLSFANTQPQNGKLCLPLSNMPLYGTGTSKLAQAKPASVLPKSLSLGMSKQMAIARLKQYGQPYQPDGEESDKDEWTIELCGDARDVVMPLFHFKDGRLSQIEFSEVEP